MKQKLVLLFSILLCAVGYAKAQEISTFTGKWNGPENESKISLFKTHEGRLVEVATSQLNSEQRFTFAVEQSKAQFYTIGINPLGMRDKYNFYMKPGDRLSVEIDNNEFTYKLVGKNTPENVEVARWFETSRMFIFKSAYFSKSRSTYVDFFPELESFLVTSKNYKVKGSVDKEFKRRFDLYRYYDLQFYAVLFTRTPRPAHPEADEFPEFYKTQNFPEISKSNDLLDYPYGIHLMTFIQARTSGNKTINENLALMGTDELRGEFLIRELEILHDYKKVLAFVKEYDKYFLTDYAKTTSKEKVLGLAKTEVGADAIDFTFVDKTGKQVSLSDFKGKVVYVDVWATWCGPCKKEAPFWATLYNEYKGKDIIFLGVSVDGEKDREKWLDHLKNEGEIGVQIFAGQLFENIQRPYLIKGIPHFLLIGKDGKIISSKAARPSSQEIRGILDTALAK